MASNDYQFFDHWRVKGTVEEVRDIILHDADLHRWWPSVYLDARVIEPGDAQGVGRVTDTHVKGWLPYALHLHLRLAQIRPESITLESRGDLNGRGIWTFAQDGEWVNVQYDWRIQGDKWFLRYLSLLLKPLFASNHHWCMARGEESIKLELQRRRAKTPQEQARVAAPPEPIPALPAPLLFGATALLALFGGLFYVRLRSRSRN